MPGAIVHEWIARSGGSENVFHAMAQTFPDADLHCLWNDDPVRFNASKVGETWIANSLFRRNKALALPLMPLAWRRLESRYSYEWMLVSSHLFAHHARFPDQPDVPKYVYTHTPARYIWNPELDERGQSLPVRSVSKVFKRLDLHRSREALEVAANSEFIRQRILTSWGRDSRVIYPPVDVETIQSQDDWSSHVNSDEQQVIESLPRDFILGASRFVPYKGLDRVIEVGQLLNMPVVLAGSGPEENRLRGMAEASSVPVMFINRPSSALLYSLYQNCLLYVFPPVEDFGIMPVEAMAAGARVLANKAGGAAESVVDGLTGSLSTFASGGEMKEAAKIALATDRSASVSRARLFSQERFSRELRAWLPSSGARPAGSGS